MQSVSVRVLNVPYGELIVSVWIYHLASVVQFILFVGHSSNINIRLPFKTSLKPCGSR